MSDTKNPQRKSPFIPVSAAIWRNQNPKGVFYSVTFERSYKDDAGKWQTSATFNADDLLLLAKVADQAHSEIFELRAGDRQADSRRRRSLADRGRALSRVPCPFFCQACPRQTVAAMRCRAFLRIEPARPGSNKNAPGHPRSLKQTISYAALRFARIKPSETFADRPKFF